GYTPRLAVAVWVGYPNKLRPMLTEFNGEEVAGGTYPALIWRAFMKRALQHLDAEPDDFASPPALYPETRYVVLRDGELQLDNGVCRGAVQVAVLSGGGPRRVADCRPNEVDVPDVVGARISEAHAILAAQPLRPLVVYRRAAPRQRLGIVLEQHPRPAARLVAGQIVTLVLPKPLHGVVPRVEGLALRRALAKLERFRLEARVRPDGAPASRRVVRQWPRPGVAAAPGMLIKLLVARG
ncbi:MAG: PASTA domain-containing protein, partial [Actinomycetota bacterium]|nr:PASTA domain-containing protein [Actinomycetota bacterium]